MTRFMQRFLAATTVVVVGGCASVSAPKPMPTPVSPPMGAPAPAKSLTPAPSEPAQPAEPLPHDVAQPTAEPRRMTVGEFAQRNDERLLQVYVGMSRRSVERLMHGADRNPYANPFRRQLLTDAHGERYEVLYFLTHVPAHGRRITENQLTPVIFREDRVVAIGRFPLKKLRRGECPARRNACPD